MARRPESPAIRRVDLHAIDAKPAGVLDGVANK
jgi:hypothetical protein